MAAAGGDALVEEDEDWDFEDEDEIDIAADMEAAGLAALEDPVAVGSGDDTDRTASNAQSKVDLLFSGKCDDPVCVSEQDLDEIRAKLVRSVRAVHSISKVAADTVLQYCNWQLDDAVTTLSTTDESESLESLLKVSLQREASAEAPAADAMDADTLAAVGGAPAEASAEDGSSLKHPSLPPGSVFPADAAARGELMCEICFNMLETEAAAYAMACGHWFCRDCYGAHVQEAIGLLATSKTKPTCPQHGCEAMLTEAEYREFLPPEKLELFKTISRGAFIRGNPCITKCRQKGCDLYSFFWEPEDAENVGVRCDCGREYCFGCGRVYHAPLGCDHMSAWRKRVKVADRVMARTGHMSSAVASSAEHPGEGAEGLGPSYSTKDHKRCPNMACRALTNKVSGCMFMQCAACGFFWCWQCGQHNKQADKVHHVFHCDNKPDPKWEAINDPRRLMMDLDRFGWYYKRFKKHRDVFEEAPSKLDRETMAQAIKAKTTVAQVDYINECLADIKEARRAICWAFSYSYFLKEGSLDQRRFRATMSILLDLVENLQRWVNPTHHGRVFAEYFADPKIFSRVRDLQHAMQRSGLEIQAYTLYDEDSMADASVLVDVLREMYGTKKSGGAAAGAAAGGAASGGAGSVEISGARAERIGRNAVVKGKAFSKELGGSNAPAEGVYNAPWIDEILGDEEEGGWKKRIGKSKSRSKPKRIGVPGHGVRVLGQ